jgi:hypothetical protein
MFLSGWDDLFNKCSENLNSLVAMKLSPYYKGDILLHTCLTFAKSLLQYSRKRCVSAVSQRDLR